MKAIMQHCWISLAFLLCLSLFVSSGNVIGAVPSLSGAYWIMPVPADQSTGKVTQTETSIGVVGYIPGDCYGAYPTIACSSGYWDLRAKHFLSFDFYANEFWQGDLKDHTGFSVIIVDSTGGVWNPSEESACDLSLSYGHAVTLKDGTVMRVADSTTPQHFVVDLASLGVPLGHVTQLIWSLRPGMKGIDCSYSISNIELSSTVSVEVADWSQTITWRCIDG